MCRLIFRAPPLTGDNGVLIMIKMIHVIFYTGQRIVPRLAAFNLELLAKKVCSFGEHKRLCLSRCLLDNQISCRRFVPTRRVATRTCELVSRVYFWRRESQRVRHQMTVELPFIRTRIDRISVIFLVGMRSSFMFV